MASKELHVLTAADELVVHYEDQESAASALDRFRESAASGAFEQVKVSLPGGSAESAKLMTLNWRSVIAAWVEPDKGATPAQSTSVAGMQLPPNRPSGQDRY